MKKILKHFWWQKFLRILPVRVRGFWLARCYKAFLFEWMRMEKIATEKTVFIIQASFFDPKGQCCFYGGAEKYMLDLADLCQRKEINCVLLQYSNEGLWVRKEKNLWVVAIPTVGSAEVYYEEIFYLLKSVCSYQVLYSWCAGSYRMTPGSLLLSHGVFWDSYLKTKTLESKRLQEIKTQLINCKVLLSVDVNTLSWFRCTFPSFSRNKTMCYIPNYVDVSKFYPAAECSTKIRILFPRRATYYRGYWIMSQAGRRILQEFPNTELAFVGFVHEGDIAKDIMLLKQEFPNRIIQEAVSPDKMPDFYRSAQIVVIPTIYSEGTSLSCLEAMASGCAVVSSNVGGLANIVLKDFNGLLVNPTVEDFYKALKELITSPNLRSFLANNAIKTAAVFNKEKWENSWSQILFDKTSSPF